MELRHLRYFVAVAEELNYRRAAERLRVAQPSLSSQIKDLEHDVGVRLLDRDTGGVRLTDAGAAFLEEARLIMAHAERAVVVAREAAKGRRGRLVVGYFAPIFMGLMPASLKAFRDKFPDVTVDLVEMPISEQITALGAGLIHIGFTVGGSVPLPENLKSAEVARSPVRVVMGRSHRLARLARIAPADLMRETLLCFAIKKGAPSVHGEVMRRFFAARGLKPPAIQEITGVEVFRATLESGMGVSLVAELGSIAQSRGLVLKSLKQDSPDMMLELHALWRDGPTSQLTVNFIETLRQVGPQGGRLSVPRSEVTRATVKTRKSRATRE